MFSGFTIAANFSRADPGAKKRKNNTKAIEKFKAQVFPKGSDRFLNPY
jgi:hypothetical protein